MVELLEDFFHLQEVIEEARQDNCDAFDNEIIRQICRAFRAGPRNGFYQTFDEQGRLNFEFSFIGKDGQPQAKSLEKIPPCLKEVVSTKCRCCSKEIPLLLVRKKIQRKVKVYQARKEESRLEEKTALAYLVVECGRVVLASPDKELSLEELGVEENV